MRRLAGTWLPAVVFLLLTLTPVAPLRAQALPAEGTTSDPLVTKWMRRFLRLPPEQRGLAAMYGDFPASRAREAPAPLRMMAGDYYLRSGRPRVAGRLFADVLETSQGTEMAPYAELGLAWSAFGTGDLDTARVFLRHGSTTGVGVYGNRMASIVLALLEASDGRYAEAQALLDEVTARGDLTPIGLEVARLARGYVRFWSGDLAAALASFDAVAGSPQASGLADDARYAAAWTRYRSGATDDGIRDLRALADTPGSCQASADEINLTPRAVLRDSFRRYRQGGAQLPDVHLARMLDADGRARACAALRSLDRGVVPEPVEHERGRVVRHRIKTQQPAVATPSPATPIAPPPAPEPPHRPFTIELLLALLVALSLVAWALRARRTSTSTRGR